MKIDLEEKYDNKKVVSRMGVIFTLLVLGFMTILFWWNQRIVPVDISGCQMDGGQLVYKVNKTYGSNYIQLDGYAYVPGKSIDYAAISILAYNPAEDKYYELPTEIVKKKRVTKNVNDGYNYDNCGFVSVVLADKIWNGTKFYIRCRHNGGDILADTGKTYEY